MAPRRRKNRSRRAYELRGQGEEQKISASTTEEKKVVALETLQTTITSSTTAASAVSTTKPTVEIDTPPGRRRSSGENRFKRSQSLFSFDDALKAARGPHFASAPPFCSQETQTHIGHSRFVFVPGKKLLPGTMIRPLMVSMLMCNI